jgi:GntR family transcriptional regulator, rspAB operon transcriptional repressor
MAPSCCTLSDEAYRAIKDMIISVRLTPGAHVTESQLSAMLAVGKTPVREALARLQREEFIDCIPRSGYRVAPLTLKAVQELFALRILLEGEAVHLASGKDYSETALARLEQLCHISVAAGTHDAFCRALAENSEFHILLAQGSGNHHLVSLFRQVMQHMERILHIGLSMTTEEDIDYTREHSDLLHAVLRGNGEEARAVVEAQNRVWQARIIEILLSSEAVLSANLCPVESVPRLSLVSAVKPD